MEGQPDQNIIISNQTNISTDSNAERENVPVDPVQSTQSDKEASDSSVDNLKMIKDNTVIHKRPHSTLTNDNDEQSNSTNIINNNNNNENNNNKKVKTEHSYEVTSNGIDTDDDSKTTCDSANPPPPPEEEKPIEKEELEIFMKDQLEARGETILEDIIEHYFLKSGNSILIYHDWKKRVLPGIIVQCIHEWFQTISNNNVFVEYIIKLLNQNVAAGKISDHSHLVNTSFSMLTSSPSTVGANVVPTLNHIETATISESNSRISASILPSTNVNCTPIVSSAQLSNGLASTVLSSEKAIPSRKNSVAAVLDNETTSGTSIIELAKQEASVVAKVNTLRKNGLWSLKRLPKLQEPPRNKVQWDYLLEEMQWLAADFLQERKWKRNSAKKCGKMITKYHENIQSKDERDQKEEMVRMRRLANNIAKMVKQFWSQIERVVEMKQGLQLKEKRKKIHDMQLRFIVDKADHLTEKLTQEFVTPSLKNSRTPSINSDLMTDQSDVEEETEGLIKTETSNQQIVELLKKESEIPIEEIVDSLPTEFVEKLTDPSSTNSANNELEDDMEFEQGNSCSDDDEETISKEEDQEANESGDHVNEIDNLESDAQIPINELLSRFGYTNEALESDDKTEYTTADDETENNDSDENEESSSETEDDVEEHAEIGIQYLIEQNNETTNDLIDTNSSESNKEITDIVAAAAESIQPKGNTLSSVQVITKVPFLLKYQLREYQHIGLDWLVAMFEKNLNGILADEMGLGKTIQTISLIAHLACEKGIWGPHLIVVPTSVMLNWEMEFKKWCPALKILTYYGNPKERRIKRKGWTKPNTFHVCITSYKLVVQDHQSFRRKKWIYFILDEAQHIKNFQSQRWQMLLNFNSSRRLLLTGTPLQNNLMELWSLMHFLMPNVFQSHREFKDWFVNPVTGMVEGNNEKNDELIRRLHKVLRPFLLRRLKCDVEKQLPKKYEHIVPCSLSKRQRLLYDEFMSLGKTKETLATGNFLSVINILMQLRKVCNHPNLFDPRPTVSPFIDQGFVYSIPSLINSVIDYQPLMEVALQTLNLTFSHFSNSFSFCDQKKIFELQYNSSQMEKVWNSEPQVYLRLSDYSTFRRYMNGIKFVPQATNQVVLSKSILNSPVRNCGLYGPPLGSRSDQLKVLQVNNSQIIQNIQPPKLDAMNTINQLEPKAEIVEFTNGEIDDQNKEGYLGTGKFARNDNISSLEIMKKDKLKRLASINMRRCSLTAHYTKDFLNFFQLGTNVNSESFHSSSTFSLGNGFSHCRQTQYDVEAENLTNSLGEILYTPEKLESDLHQILDRFLCIVPNVISSPIKLSINSMPSYKRIDHLNFIEDLENKLPPTFFNVINVPRIQLRFQLPELRLIQYDCGKLQVLCRLLWQLKSQKHRVLIFTQMSRMLDIFEQFLNYHGHTYLRLDGSTKIEQRQALMERFNADQRIFCFILSTRSGGVGVNLTGADTVIFYDSDWNPTMDAQAQDRCHRIGQTRDVHIYRLVSQRTVEENILKKAQQKKLLGDLAIEEGNFTTAFFKEAAIKDLFEIDQTDTNANNEASASNSVEIVHESHVTNERVEDDVAPSSLDNAFEQALCTAEEETDVAAAKVVRDEAAAEFDEFDENIPIEEISYEKSAEEEKVDQLIANLTPVERLAMKRVESLQDFSELQQVEDEIEETKKQWKQSISEWRKNQDEPRRKMFNQIQESLMTCSREDSSFEKVKNSKNFKLSNKSNAKNSYVSSDELAKTDDDVDNSTNWKKSSKRQVRTKNSLNKRLLRSTKGLEKPNNLRNGKSLSQNCDMLRNGRSNAKDKTSRPMFSSLTNQSRRVGKLVANQSTNNMSPTRVGRHHVRSTTLEPNHDYSPRRSIRTSPRAKAIDHAESAIQIDRNLRTRRASIRH